MAQTVSMVVDKGNAPWVGTRRAVFLNPTMPFKAAGMRMEPPVSEPRPIKAAPVDTEVELQYRGHAYHHRQAEAAQQVNQG